MDTMFIAPFSGAGITLTKPSTVCEYNGTMSGTSWKDVSPLGLFSMSPTGSPSVGASTVMMADGNLWRGRTFNGSSDYYSVAHSDALNVAGGDFTLTMVVLPSVATESPIFYKYTAVPTVTGIYVQMSSGSAVGAYFYNSGLGSSKSVVSPSSGSIGMYNVVQLVRRSDIARCGVGGSWGGPSANLAGYGSNTTGAIRIGNGNGIYLNGSVLYCRVDATALSDEELEFDRLCLMGAGVHTPSYAPPTFTRATTSATVVGTGYANVNGQLKARPQNTPRVGTHGLRIEDARTNLLLQSQTLNTTWTKLDGGLDTISSDGATAPDGTTTADGVIGFDNNVPHGITQAVTLTATSYYAISMYAKVGNQNWLYISDNDVVNGFAYFDLANNKMGTVGVGVLSGCYNIEALDNGWCWCWIAVAGTAAPHTIQIGPAYADGDNDFAGDHLTVNTWLWNPQVEAGTHPTSAIATTSSSVQRVADYLVARSFDLCTSLQLGTETWSTTFDQDVASSGTVTLGGKTFTQAGNAMHRRTPDLKHFYEFDGLGDYLAIADSDFNPGGAFSLVAVYTPNTLAATVDICNKGTAADVAFRLLCSTATASMRVCYDGVWANGTSVSRAGALVAGRTALITATFDGTTGLWLYVDDLAVATATTAQPGIWNSSQAFMLGNTTGTTMYGKLHYLAYYKGTRLLQADHDTLYTRLRRGGTLPLAIDHDTSISHKSKLYIEFDAKCIWANTTAMGSSTPRCFLEIAGNWSGNTASQVASAVNNRIRICQHTNGYFYFHLYDSGGGEHYIRSNSTNPLDFSKWHHYQFYLDTVDMANSYVKVDGATTGFTSKSGMTGNITNPVRMHNCLVRIGHDFAATVGSYLDGDIKNVRIATE